MSEAIIVALITGGLSLVGVVITNLAAARKNEAAIRTAQAVTDTKLEELTREVREHNNFAHRVPVLEEECDAWFWDYFSSGDEDITSEDPTVWGAEEVWRAGDLWLLRWEDRTVTLFTSWPMTDEAIAIAARQLAP